jgi:hypothetical protein
MPLKQVQWSNITRALLLFDSTVEIMYRRCGSQHYPIRWKLGLHIHDMIVLYVIYASSWDTNECVRRNSKTSVYVQPRTGIFIDRYILKSVHVIAKEHTFAFGRQARSLSIVLILADRNEPTLLIVAHSLTYYDEEPERWMRDRVLDMHLDGQTNVKIHDKEVWWAMSPMGNTKTRWQALVAIIGRPFTWIEDTYIYI